MRIENFAVIVFLVFCFFPQKSKAQETRFLYVDPIIGSGGLGRVFIGPSYPFGMVKPGPDCTARSNSGWLPDPAPVTGFSQTHVSGTGGGPKYGNIQIMPFSGSLNKQDQSSQRENEKIELGYYGVTLKKSGIKVEITTAERTSFYRFIYPEDATKAIKIDPGFFLGEQEEPKAREAQQFVGSEIEVVSDYEIRGYSRIRGGWNNGGAYTVYFYAIFDQPTTNVVTWKDGQLFAGESSQFDSGEKTGALLAFNSDSARDTINVKIGISFLSSLKAKNNANHEIPHWNFNIVLNNLQQQWEKLLSCIDLAADTPDDYKKMFYTGLYHTMLMPVDRTGENPLWKSVRPYYDDFYTLWDTYRSSNPLITLISPDREIDIVNAMLDIYQYEGYLPDGRSGNANGRTQGGSNAEVLIADAFVKNLQGVDYNLALQAMLKDATIPPGGNEEQEGRGGLVEYKQLGYIPYGIPRAGNRTVDYSYNDYNIAVVAKGLGGKDLCITYLEQSDNWKNLWRADYENNGATGFIMPKSTDGKWLDEVVFGHSKIQKPTFTYTPLTREAPWYVKWWSVFFYEGTSWEYSFSIPHDIPALINLCGGEKLFRERLDIFFNKKFYNVANEPSFLTPCLYHWIGRPDLSGERIQKIIASHFNASRKGIPGNDDSGAMSSWLAFHMMGLYPNAGQDYYLLHSPIIRETTLHFGKGKDFRIVAENMNDKNRYIKSAWLNGRPYDKAWIRHKDIISGGELIFEMDSEPSQWGTKILPPGKITIDKD
ncbi:MAG: GH92 family glycosyl hydrolase [Mangrovibacterium sp.]